MHRPPAVSYSVVRSRWYARALGVVWVTGAALVQLALWRYHYAIATMALLEGVCLVAGLAAVWAWRAAPQGVLRWDGDHWHWSGFAGEPVLQVAVHFDFQTLLLVSVQCQGHAPMWLWLDRASASRTHWLALRRALVSGRPSADPMALSHEQLL